MFTNRSFLWRLLYNFGFTFGLFFLFTGVGWITLTGTLPLWEVAGIVVLASLLVQSFAELIFLLLSPFITCFTLGCGLFLAPAIVQYGVLLAISYFSHLFTVPFAWNMWWQILLIGLAFAFFHVSRPSSSSSSRTTRTTTYRYH